MSLLSHMLSPIFPWMMNSFEMHSLSISGKGCKRISHTTYFVERFSELLPYTDLKSQELLFTQFVEFQTMQDSVIPAHCWNDAKVREKGDGDEVVEYHRMDILWSYLGSVKDMVTSQHSF